MPTPVAAANAYAALARLTGTGGGLPKGAGRSAAPLMLVGLAVGVVISLFQALTQIQEMTLVFVPKILAIFITLLIVLPFMGDVLAGHMARIAARIVGG
jgi:flagellar biosynthesis protein FliQ